MKKYPKVILSKYIFLYFFHSLKEILKDKFCLRQFKKGFSGTFISMKQDEFLEKLRELINSEKYGIQGGYAPFCKHYFVPNFANCDAGYLKIDDNNVKLIETTYMSRRKEELPVLTRFIRKDNLEEVPKGKYLDIILYSRDQIILEDQAMGENIEHVGDYDYGVVSVKCLFQNSEVPMNPITMFRNALGKSFGGSGKDLVKEEYITSVNFWENHVNIV